MESLKICPVCGYDNLSDVPYDVFGCPTYVICPCCGFEFGFDDESERQSFEEYRKRWIAEGFPFFNNKRKLRSWNHSTMEKQLENVKKVNYKSREF